MREEGQTREPAMTALRKGCRRALLLSGIFSLGVNLLMLTVPLYMLQVFERVLLSRSEDTLLLLTAMAAFALMILGLLDALRGQVLARLGSWSERRLGGDIYAASVTRALVTGQASAQGLRDLAQVKNFLSGPALIPILDAPWTPIFIAVLFLLHPYLGWFSLAGAVILLVTVIVNELSTRRLQRAESESAIANTSAAEAGIRNADAIAAMGMLPDLVRRWQENGAEGNRLARKVAGRMSALAALSKSLRLLLQMGVLGLGAWLVVQGDLTAGAMIAGSILLGRALAPVEMAVASWRQVVQGMAALKRVRGLLDAAPVRRETTVLPVPTGRLQIERVTFVFPGQSEPLLNGVTFTLETGHALAILGSSAAGKTTLARVILGNLVPRFGSVRLDGAEIAGLSADARMRDIGYLPQDIALFPGSVRENIARMGPGDDAAVVTAAKRAGAHEAILNLPQGYDTVIGDGGVNLSGGQCQLIGLARAVFGNPRLVVLDEPNSNLDQDGETGLVAAIEALAADGATVIVISHRPAIVQHVDQILLLRNGRVERCGAREEILPSLIRPTAMHKVASPPRNDAERQAD